MSAVKRYGEVFALTVIVMFISAAMAIVIAEHNPSLTSFSASAYTHTAYRLANFLLIIFAAAIIALIVIPPLASILRATAHV